MTNHNEAEGHRSMTETAMQWQPIETAPRDGTGFIYFQKLPFGQKWIGSAIYNKGRCLHVQWNGEEEDWTTISPSHWMPLPPAPSDTEGQG